MRLSTPLDDPIPFARGLIWPFARWFHELGFASRPDSPPGTACWLVQHNTTRGRIHGSRSLRPFLNVSDAPPRGLAGWAPSREEHRHECPTPSPTRRKPGHPCHPTEFRGSEKIPVPSAGQDLALQRIPRRARLGYRSDAFHCDLRARPLSFLRTARVTPESFAP